MTNRQKLINNLNRWSKHTYINKTPWDVELIDSKDQSSRLTLLTAHSTCHGHKTTPNSKTITINSTDVYTDAQGSRWILSPLV
jgi:hypothetical protein